MRSIAVGDSCRWIPAKIVNECAPLPQQNCALKAFLIDCEQRRHRRMPNQVASDFVLLRIKSVEVASVTPRCRSPSATSNRDTHYLPFGQFRKRNIALSDSRRSIPVKIVHESASLPVRVAPESIPDRFRAAKASANAESGQI